MKWKTLFWTVAVSVLIFFVLVFLGMKFQWVRALQDKKTLENEKVILEIPKVPDPVLLPSGSLEEKQPAASEAASHAMSAQQNFSHSLVGEETQLVNFTGMSLEAVVEECGRISKKVGIPAERLIQSVNECVTRNFQEVITDNPTNAQTMETKFRDQCKQTIPLEQQTLFSPEEMKLIIDECVVELKKNKKAQDGV